ncbi:hypothetical protein ACF0H5_014202 [Mactra antiquata]
MSSDGGIDSLSADSELKYLIGDYEELYGNKNEDTIKSKKVASKDNEYCDGDNSKEDLVDCDNQEKLNGARQQETKTITVGDADKSGDANLENIDDVDGLDGEVLPVDKNGTELGLIENGNKVLPENETIAIYKFSDALADNIIQEAFLINDIYNRDKDDNETETNDINRDLNIKKTLFPNDNGVINGRDNGGYDSYLIDKFLRSKADPEEVPDTEGFDGKEEHFKRDKELTYPGLDRDDAYVKAESERSQSDRESSDKNNNEMPPGVIEPYDDNVLETIHEDAELVIERSNKVNDELSIDHVADANKIDTVDKIDEGVVDDVEYDGDDDDDGGEDEDVDKTEVIDSGRRSKAQSEKKDGEMIEDGNENWETFDEDIEDPEEPNCCGMTHHQKKSMVFAVRHGDIDKLEYLLERRNADVNMIWYGENLLMVAIRAKKEEMCEFLIDNGIDWEYETKLVDVDEQGEISVHKITARQMAYDLQLLDIVEILDCKSDNVFPFIVPKEREPRLRQPIIPFFPAPLDEGIREEVFMDQDEQLKSHKRDLKERARVAAAELEEKQRLEKLKKIAANNPGVLDDCFNTVKSKHSISDDDISQVFGPDEGYETMSPDLSRSNRHDYHAYEPVSIRSTRACNLKKAHIASKLNDVKRMESPDYPMNLSNHIESVGSYSFESRYWHMPKSAPQVRNYSMESLNDTSVHMGLPFVHGTSPRKPQTAPSSAKSCVPRRRVRSTSAHTNISPFSQVAKLLEQSKLFSPFDKSRATTPLLPAISSRNSSASNVTYTKINYIYADRNSAKYPRKETSFAERPDLLPRRKLKC